jgi:hypothetical protein
MKKKFTIARIKLAATGDSYRLKMQMIVGHAEVVGFSFSFMFRRLKRERKTKAK